MQDTTVKQALGTKIGMDPDRRAALTAGVLFITATVTSVVGTGLSRPLVNDPDYLGRVSAHANQVTVGALFELIAAAASAGIAISLYPVLKRWNAGLALGAVVFRTIDPFLSSRYRSPDRLANIAGLLGQVVLGSTVGLGVGLARW